MGLMGRYIDALPAEARDRLIQAQDWCVASVRMPDGARCLVGHAEDWGALAVEDTAWRSWLDAGTASPALSPPGASAPASELDLLCRPELFAFRRARPADLAAYRARLMRWGAASESRIGARFDRLCARHGLDGAVRTVKRRAGRAFAIDVEARVEAGPASVRAVQVRERASTRRAGSCAAPPPLA
ncbi:MAG TPA: hypothetical protein VK358_08525 [Longimicrobium sp.]|nr:hypothetical protein [Longimicrobium sp.]